MEILFISHKYPPVIGGMEKHSFELLSRLKKQHTVHSLLYDNQEGRFTFFRSLKKRVRAILQTYPTIEMVYVNDGLLACFMTWLKKETNIPLVATVHGLDVVHPNAFYQHFIKKNLAKLDAIIAVSQATANACLIRGIAKDKVFVVKNGVDHDLADIPIEKDFLIKFEEKYQLSLKGKRLLVTMGRPVKRKGFSWFVKEVVPHLEEDIVLLMIGPKKGQLPRYWKYLPRFIQRQLALAMGISTDETALTEVLQQPNIQEKAIQVGKLPFSEVLQLLSAAHLFVMPNIQVPGDMEGFGLVALESAIRGTPVLAAGIEGIKDAIIDGKNGHLLASKNAEVWIDTIHLLLDHPTAVQAWSKKAKQFTIDNYSWRIMVEGYEEVFFETRKAQKFTKYFHKSVFFETQNT